MDCFTLLAYVGPDTILPLGSILTAATGMALIFWRQPVSMVKKLLGFADRSEE